MKAWFNSTLLEDLRVKGPQVSFNTAHLLPHGYETISAVEKLKEDDSLRNLQILLGEASAKTAKVNTKGICTTVIRDEHAVIGCCANMTVLLRTFVTFEPTTIDEKKAPFLHVAARQLAIVVTSKEYRECTKKNLCNAMLNYYVFNLFDRIHTAVTRIHRCETSINAAMPGNGTGSVSNISTTPYRSARKILDKGLETLVSIITGSEDLSSTPIFSSSPFSPANLAVQATLLDATNKRKYGGSPKGGGDPKKPKFETPTKEKGDKKNAGAINCATNALIRLPEAASWPEGETELCAGKLRNKSSGCRNNTCKKNHKHPSQWSPALIAFMKTIVDADNNLSWNPAVATPDIFGLTYNKPKAEV